VSKIFFTADTHFFHKNIIKFCPNSRRGADQFEMNEILIRNWNAQVAHDDIVYHLGDVSFARDYRDTESVVNRLEGQIHVITGNHDDEAALRRTKRFRSVSAYKEVSIFGTKVVMFHYPIHEWNCIQHGAIHLYGHVHGRSLEDLPQGKSMDVGIDTRRDMRLYEWEEIEKIMSSRPLRRHHN